MKKFIISLITLGLMFTACEKTYISSNGAISFGSTVTSTKATVNVGPNDCGYDRFNVFSEEAGMNPYLVTWNGSEWVYDGIGGQTLKQFDRNNQSYNFIGVISDKDGIYNNQSVTVSNVEAFLTNDEGNTPKEYLWAGTNVTDYTSKVSLHFNHGNAKMYIAFASDRNDTEILDYTPYVPAQPAQPAVPGTETYTKKTTKFIDELVAGNEVQVAIGFYGVNSPKLTKTNPNPLYVGADNTSNGYLAKTWLLSIKDAVNSQFVYYRLNAVANSTSKTETTEDWESAASNKNIFMMKLADGVDKAAFAAGNDAFATALKAHQTDWVGGSPVESFWAMFEQAYADGWRVVRINVSDANANQVLVFLSSNIEATTQICEVTGGSPAVPATPESGLNGIRVFSVDASGTPVVRANHTAKADATVTISNNVFSNPTSASDSLIFSLPTNPVAQYANKTDIDLNSAVSISPSVWYAVPISNTAWVVKFSYKYNGENHYDARVLIPLVSADFAQGAYYKYVIYIDSSTGGVTDPNVAETEKDEVDTTEKPIIFNNITFGNYTGNIYIL